MYRRRNGEARGLTWAGYRGLILAARWALSAPLAWVRGNLSIRLAPELAGSPGTMRPGGGSAGCPAYTPGLNPAEGTWPLLKRSMVSFAAAGLDGLVRIIKRKLNKIRYRPRLINGCLAAACRRTGPRQSRARRVPSAVSRCSLIAVAAAGLLLPEGFSRCRPQPGYRSGYDQG